MILGDNHSVVFGGVVFGGLDYTSYCPSPAGSPANLTSITCFPGVLAVKKNVSFPRKNTVIIELQPNINIYPTTIFHRKSTNCILLLPHFLELLKLLEYVTSPTNIILVLVKGYLLASGVQDLDLQITIPSFSRINLELGDRS